MSVCFQEHVYPKFEAVARSWLEILDEARSVKARQSALADLHSRNKTYHGTLAGDSPLCLAAKRAAAGEGYHGYPGDGQPAGGAARDTAQHNGLDTTPGNQSGLRPDSPSTNSVGSSRNGSSISSSGLGRISSGAAAEERRTSANNSNASMKTTKPVVLSMESTPEFFQLPLEYQGFCPWSIVERKGLLMPGKPALGIVRHGDQFFAFAHATALQAFLEEPEAY